MSELEQFYKSLDSFISGKRIIEHPVKDSTLPCSLEEIHDLIRSHYNSVVAPHDTYLYELRNQLDESGELSMEYAGSIKKYLFIDLYDCHEFARSTVTKAAYLDECCENVDPFIRISSYFIARGSISHNLLEHFDDIRETRFTLDKKRIDYPELVRSFKLIHRLNYFLKEFPACAGQMYMLERERKQAFLDEYYLKVKWILDEESRVLNKFKI